MDHQFLNAKNAGICQTLVGKIYFMIVFIDDQDSQWYQQDIRHFNQLYQGVVDFFTQQSQKYHISLQFQKYSYRTSIPLSVQFNNAHEWDHEVVKNVWHESIDTIQSTLKQQLSCDEVPILFLLNKNGRSNAHNVEKNSQINYEYATLFLQTGDSDKQIIKGIAHETCHLFGASDYYYPEKACEYAKKYLENSIMNIGDDYIIDSLTAYCIGWTNVLDDHAQKFLNATENISHKDILKGRKETSFIGTKYKKYDTGTIYFGDFIDNKCDGQGLIRYSNNDIYQGEWKNSQIHGYGILIEHGGNVYTGEWQNNAKSGFGIYYEDNGYIYVGDFSDNQRNGLGFLQYPQGWMLYGHWKNGIAEGFGLMITDTNIYAGNWLNNKRHGQAYEMNFDGDVYAGFWKNDYKDGDIIFYHDQNTYLCHFVMGQLIRKTPTKDSLYHQHYMKYDIGTVYYGDWKNNCIFGKGLIKFHNNDIYYGDWKNSRFDGFGLYVDYDGNVYIGEWSHHQKHGNGIWIDTSGEIYRGLWQNNQLMKRMK